MIIKMPTKRILAISQWQTFLPTIWRRKPAGIDMNGNYVTVTLCIVIAMFGVMFLVIMS